MSGVMVMPWVVIEGTPRLPSPSAESRDRVALDPVNPPAALPGINGSPAPYALGCSGTASTMSPGDAALSEAALDVTGTLSGIQPACEVMSGDRLLGIPALEPITQMLFSREVQG